MKKSMTLHDGNEESKYRVAERAWIQSISLRNSSQRAEIHLTRSMGLELSELPQRMPKREQLFILFTTRIWLSVARVQHYEHCKRFTVGKALLYIVRPSLPRLVFNSRALASETHLVIGLAGLYPSRGAGAIVRSLWTARREDALSCHVAMELFSNMFRR